MIPTEPPLGMSEGAYIIIATIGSVISLIGTCFTAWIGLQMARIDRGVKRGTADIQTSIQAADEKLDANAEKLETNTEISRDARHSIRNVAQAHVLTRERLLSEQQNVRTQLSEIKDSSRLINGERGRLLEENAETLRTLAEITKDPEHIVRAEAAEKLSADYSAKSAQIDPADDARKEGQAATEKCIQEKEEKVTEEIKQLNKEKDNA